MPIDGDELGRQAADVTELLALSGLRRSLEPQPAFELDAALVAEVTAPAVDVIDTIKELKELIDAIDRRLPQVERAGECAIATAALHLRIEAPKRIDVLAMAVAGRESVDPRPHVST
jgi:hypothetical protein